MTMQEWFCEFDFHQGDEKVCGTGITERRQDELDAFAEQVKAKRNGRKAV